MKITKFWLTLNLFIFTTGASAQVVNPHLESIQIEGYVGERIQTCIDKRVKGQDVNELIEPFRHLTEGNRWQSEFFGKWLLGAIASYRYCTDQELFRIIQNSVEDFIQTQHPDGYIGNYKPEDRLTNWDIWGRKYSALALLDYYRLTNDKKALEAARRSIDCLMDELAEHNVDIATTGNYLGMASCSILEPVVYLYRATRDDRYLNFAKEIVSGMEKTGSSRLISQALQDVPVSQRSPFPKQWWSFDNGQKAYEMMSCYEGLIELGKELDDPLFLEAARKTADHILKEEINIAGSGAAFECWYGGKALQTIPAYHTMETCVTFTWMQFCARLLRETANPLYAEEFERTMYNALMASMKDDGTQISKYSPLEGRRQPGEKQCGMRINCCNANGPRGFALIPSVAYQSEEDHLFVNLYLPSKATIKLGNRNKVTLTSHTQYPLDGKVELKLEPQKSSIFALALRIPSWADDNYEVNVNGEQQKALCRGSYLTIKRTWKKGDLVTIDFKPKARVIEQNHAQAVIYGPLVFARDTRFHDGDVDECAIIQCDRQGYVNTTPESASASFAWITLKVPMVLGTDLENEENKAVKIINFCDFASAGNDWRPEGRYRIWIPKTLHVMSEPYHRY